MKKLFLFLMSLFLFVSCTAQKKEYEVVNLAINQIFSKEKGCDTLDVVKKTTVINPAIFKVYTKEKKEKESGFVSTAHIFRWVDENEKWILTDDDLKYFEANKSQPLILKKEKISDDRMKCILVDKPAYESDLQKSKEVTRRIINCRFICEFTTPIFNKKKNIALIVRYEILFNEVSMLIYKLDNQQWKLVGYTEHSTE